MVDGKAELVEYFLFSMKKSTTLVVDLEYISFPKLVDFMEKLIRQNTKVTPYVHLDSASNTYVIGGRSIPIDAEIFYRPILNWLDALHEEGKVKNLQFCFRFDFFNIASSKRILFLLYKLLEMQKNGVSVMVRWMYEKNDDDMLEIGEDYAYMINDLHFVFEEFDIEKLKKERLLKLG